MTTSTIKSLFINRRQARTNPVTPRGRALYTVDWVLNGKPVLRNHDIPSLGIRQLDLN
jgi:hypothetical protein